MRFVHYYLLFFLTNILDIIQHYTHA